MRCLCYAATENCNLATGCKEGKCGAFGINKLYWIDAGKPTLPEDDVERSHGKYALHYSSCNLLLNILFFFEQRGKIVH